MKEYLESASDVLESLGTAAEGLSSADAQSRLEKHGKNKLDEKKKKSLHLPIPSLSPFTPTFLR